MLRFNFNFCSFGNGKSARLQKENHKVVAIIGDGALTAGLAFEGLNNTGYLKTSMLVILNDNRMSISRT